MAGMKAQSIIGTNHDGGRPEHDFYPTPKGATLALLGAEKFPLRIWEPACGDGAISQVLIERGYSVVSSDLIDRGYGAGEVDFLKAVRQADAIITNPPYNLAEEFVIHALDLHIEKLALLLKLAFLEGQHRSCLLERTHLSRVWVFRNRLTMTRNGEPMRNGGMIAFAWFVWERGWANPPQIGWISEIRSPDQPTFPDFAKLAGK